MAWINPQDSKRSAWAGKGDAGSDADPATRSVYERAVEANTPYRRRERVRLSGESVAEQFRSREYTDAAISYDTVVSAAGERRVVARGHLWGGDDDQRYRIQYRRKGPPTETVPFDEYEVWVRYQFGTVTHIQKGEPVFKPSANPEEEKRTLSWGELYASDRFRLIEAELVGNPELARYRLKEQEVWEAIRDVFRYDPKAFGVTP